MKVQNMNIKIISIILGLFFTSCWNFSLADEILVIVAYPKEAKISDKPCHFFTKDKKNVCIDGVIELVYRVDEVIAGDYNKKRISIIDFVHSSGFPEYLTEYPVYLALVKRNGIYILVQYAKHRFIGEKEWICGKELNPLIYDTSAKAPPYVESAERTCPKGVEIQKLKTYFSDNKSFSAALD